MFCRFCGKQVLHEAYMCPSCGCMIRPLPQAVAPVTVEAPISIEPSKAHKTLHRLSKKFTNVGVVLNAVAFALMILMMCFTVIAMVLADEYYYLTELSNLTEEQIAKVEEVMDAGIVGVVFGIYGLIVIAVSSELSTLGFIFSLIQRVEPGIKKKSIPVFVVSMVLLYIVAYGFLIDMYLIILMQAGW